jgi:hypothetical protein
LDAAVQQLWNGKCWRGCWRLVHVVAPKSISDSRAGRPARLRSAGTAAAAAPAPRTQAAKVPPRCARPSRASARLHERTRSTPPEAHVARAWHASAVAPVRGGTPRGSPPRGSKQTRGYFRGMRDKMSKSLPATVNNDGSCGRRGGRESDTRTGAEPGGCGGGGAGEPSGERAAVSPCAAAGRPARLGDASGGARSGSALPPSQ